MRRLLAALCLVLAWAASASGADLRLEIPDFVGLGEPFVLRVEAQGHLSEVTVRWLDRTLRPTVVSVAEGLRAEALLGTDVLDDEPGERLLAVTAEVDGRQVSALRRVRVKAKDYPRQELTLPQGMVTPPAADQDRIARESEVNRRLRERVGDRRFWTLPLARPVAGGLGSVYGAARVLNGQARSPHRGLDFEAGAGEPVRAVADGTVALVADQYYAGKCVFVDHGNGVLSMYFHLSQARVREGFRVERGEVLGLAGSTGRSTGPHLHFALSAQGRLVDPLPLMEE